MLGASAAIFALAGCVMLVRPLKFSWLFFAPQGLIAILYFIYNVVVVYEKSRIPGYDPQVAYVAHVIGFLTGVPFGIALSDQWKGIYSLRWCSWESTSHSSAARSELFFNNLEDWNMQTYFGTALDIKNIALAKLIFDLRQDIDLHILFTANWAEIEDVFGVSGFFPQIRRRVLGGVVLGICKMYEIEGRKYQLNSIDGILKCLKEEGAQPLDQLSIATFVASYCDANGESAVSTLDRCVETVRGKYKSELEQFRTARDKVIAHSEFFALVEAVPSLDIMEQLFGFGADFYEAICESFVGTAPDDLRRNQPAMQDCIRLLEGSGIKEVKKSLPLT